MEIIIVILIILLIESNSRITKLTKKVKDITNEHDESHEEILSLRKQLREEKNKNILLQSIVNKK